MDQGNGKIELIDVSKRFKKKLVLDKISVCFEPGKIYGIIGYNGCGTSVLFKCICGLYRVSSGKILVDGRQMGKDMDVLPSAGIIIEEPAFIRDCSGLMNLKLLWGLNHRKNHKHLEEVLTMVGLDPKDKKRVDKYSLGMKQRLGLAQALMEDPQVLILDEPMNGLDQTGVAEIRSLWLSKKEEGKTILLASHNKEDISALCDEVYRFENHGLVRA